jgi:hypothetical protein
MVDRDSKQNRRGGLFSVRHDGARPRYPGDESPNYLHDPIRPPDLVARWSGSSFRIQGRRWGEITLVPAWGTPDHLLPRPKPPSVPE